MSWFFLALVGHLANAGAFVIDKMLLAKAWKHSATYAALVGLLSVLALLAFPWVKLWPRGQDLFLSCLFGGVFVLAVWAFFEALRRAEAGRIVPIVGSLIPIFTLIGTSIWLGERFTLRISLGFACLLCATFLLARSTKNDSLDSSTVCVSVLSALLFAVASVVGKAAYLQTDFLGILVTSRVAAALVGIGIFLFVRGAREEGKALFISRPSKREAKPPFVLMVFGQTLGALGFLSVNAALARGSAALVNALQAVQYAAIVFVAWFGGGFFQKILHQFY